METSGAKRRFILFHNFGRHHGRQYFHSAVSQARLLHVADHRGVHFERDALLQPEADQRLLLVRIRGEGVEIEHCDARAVIRQNQCRAALAMAVGGDQRADVLQQNMRLLDVFVYG